jgi:hypothetical protein
MLMFQMFVYSSVCHGDSVFNLLRALLLLLSRPLYLGHRLWHLLVQRLRQHQGKESGRQGKEAKDDDGNGGMNGALK